MIEPAEFRNALREFLGEERFRRWIRQLEKHGRLREIQQQAWDEFVALHPRFRMNTDELRGLLRICELHGCDLEPKTVRVTHHCVDFGPEYLETMLRSFPRPGSGPFMGPPDLKTTEIWYCPECREAEAKWRRRFTPPAY